MIKKLIICLIMITMLALVQSQVDIGSTIIKATVSSEDFITKTITLGSDTTENFKLNIDSVKGAKIEKSEFKLTSGEKEIVDIVFDARGVKPGVYIGYLKVESSSEKLSVPVIFEVESEDVFFDSNVDIPPAYKEVKQGDKITFQIKIFDLTAGGGIQQGLGPVKVDVKHTIYSIDGKVVITKEEEVVVDKQAQNSIAIGFPEDVGVGTYILSSEVKYKGSIGYSTQTFDIKEKEVESKLTGQFNYWLIGFVALALLVFIGVIVLLVYLLRERDKFLLGVKKFNVKETKYVTRTLHVQKKVLEKKQDKRELEQEMKQKLMKLKEKQQGRIDEMRKLKKLGNAEEMKKKLAEWKRRGYDTGAMEYKMNGLSAKEMKKILKRWKVKYEKPKN